MSDKFLAYVTNALLFGLTFGSLNMGFDFAEDGRWGYFAIFFILGMFFIGAYDKSVVNLHEIKQKEK